MRSCSTALRRPGMFLESARSGACYDVLALQGRSMSVATHHVGVRGLGARYPVWLVLHVPLCCHYISVSDTQHHSAYLRVLPQMGG
jgi:hypothetical protein